MHARADCVHVPNLKIGSQSMELSRISACVVFLLISVLSFARGQSQCRMFNGELPNDARVECGKPNSL